MSESHREIPTDVNAIGLCATCRHVRAQHTRRGAVFYRCARADEDERFLQYPPIPVTRCSGHERSAVG